MNQIACRDRSDQAHIQSLYELQDEHENSIEGQAELILAACDAGKGSKELDILDSCADINDALLVIMSQHFQMKITRQQAQESIGALLFPIFNSALKKRAETNFLWSE